ncbi:hypothetical protein CBU01nite_31650 [Clostridium butyricum]|nr:hypothetical protein CBU01nite_31650 [Clostridium butyricum]
MNPPIIVPMILFIPIYMLLETVSFIQKTAAIHAKKGFSLFIILKTIMHKETATAVFIFLNPNLGN